MRDLWHPLEGVAHGSRHLVREQIDRLACDQPINLIALNDE